MKKLKTPELARDISRVKIDFALQLNNLMAEKNISQSELSEKSGKSKSLISRILNGDNNLTMETMVEIYHALDEVLIISTKRLILSDVILLSSRSTYKQNQNNNMATIAMNSQGFIPHAHDSQVVKNIDFLNSLKKIHTRA